MVCKSRLKKIFAKKFFAPLRGGNIFTGMVEMGRLQKTASPAKKSHYPGFSQFLEVFRH